MQFTIGGLMVFVAVCAVAVRAAPAITKYLWQWRADVRASEEVSACISSVYASPAYDYDIWKLRLLRESLSRQQSELSPGTFRSLSRRIECEIAEVERRGNERMDVRSRELSQNQCVEVNDVPAQKGSSP